MPRQSLRILARSYYVVAGLIFGIAAGSAIWGLVWAAQDGCQLVFSQSEFAQPPSTGPIPDTLPACQHYVDVLAIALALAATVVLLAAAIRFGHADRWSRRVVGLGALVAIAIGVYSMAGIWWAADYYNDGPPDVLGIVIAALPLVIGLVAASVTWWSYSRQTHRHAPT